MLHFAVQTTAFADADDVRRTARLSEEIGYTDLFTADHIGLPDPFVPLVVAADATTALRVGPLVLDNELHHPVLLARTAATVDRQTGGRLVLGLGTGYMQAEHEAADIDLRPPAERVDRLEESLIALRSLLDHGTAHFDGRHHRLAVDDLGIRPAQRSVPLLVGGHGRRLVTTAAHHADIFQFTGLTHGRGGAPGPGGFAPDAVALRRQWLVEAAGDRLEQMTCSALVQATHVGSGADDAAAAAADRTGLDREALSNTPFVLIGSVDQVVDQVERLRDTLGITHWVVRDPAGFAPVVEALAGR